MAAVTDLSRTFAGPPQVTALHPCTFHVRSGDYVAITGPSGSGKTTLLSLLGLLDEPTSGRYVLDGIDVAGLSDVERAAVRAHRIGFVFQSFHLIGPRTVLDNVELGLMYQGVSRRQRRRRAIDVIAEVGLTPRMHALCSHLSGGEKQRVAIARSLVRNPALVLCDEPTGNLDSETSAQVLDLFDQVNETGVTVVVITHASAVASRARSQISIRDGVVTTETPPVTAEGNGAE